MTTRRSIAVAVFALVLPATAHAQVVEGPGHQVSDSMVLHPSAGVETGFVSNVFYEDAAEDPVGAGVLRVLLEASIATNSPDGRGDSSPLDETDNSGSASTGNFDFRAGLSLKYHEYLSDNENVTAQRDLGIKFDADLSLFAKNPVTFTASDTFVRETRPTNFESRGNVNRDVNRLRLGLRWRPPGRTLWGTLRYENVIDVFEQDSIDFANRIQHTVGARVVWQYLPVTRFWIDVSQGIYGPLGDGQFGAEQIKNNSYPLRFKLAGASAFTERTTARVHLGYGIGFYDSGPDFSGFLFGAEFGWRYSPLGRVVLGIEREFRDSINANFYSDYKPYVGLEQQLGVIVARAKVAYRFRTYEGVPAAVGGAASPTRSDNILSAEASAHYYYRSWLAVFGEYRAASVSTDFRIPSGAASPDDDPSYVRHEVFVGAQAAF